WENGEFTYYRYLLDSVYNLDLIETADYLDSTFATQETMVAPSVQLIRLIKKTTSVEKENCIFDVPPILQNVPNPFSSSVIIKYSLPRSIAVSLKIYNLTGHLVKILVSDTQKAGTYTVAWNSRDDEGKLMSSGIYFVKFQAGEFSQTKKLLLFQP
ncbi:MAG: T9SS type A sorting domain-containing protein, partial [Candidatus Stahlbacteria bacterium]|nr:T9SS type A sorting domain-containing protein [Candidatus Stahlbacteria bacterium]